MNKQKPKANYVSKVSYLLLAAVLIFSALTGCNGGGNGGGSGSGGSSRTVSPEATTATIDGVTVELGDYILDGEETLSVTRSQTIESAEDGYRIEAYDIKLGDRRELDDFIKIRIPYDESYCDPGQKPENCVGGVYFNEEAGEWESVLCGIDTEKKELIIYTDHLSTYGLYEVKNSGKRNAYLTGFFLDPDAFGIDFVDIDEALAVINEFGLGFGQSEKGVSLGAKLMGGVDLSGEWISNYGSVSTIVQAGADVFEGTMFSDINTTLGTVGSILSATKIAVTAFSPDKSDADKLGMYKDSVMLALDVAASSGSPLASGALSVALSGVWVFDKLITYMFEEGKAIKMRDMFEPYLYYNDISKGGVHTARTNKAWRQVFINIFEANVDNPDAVKDLIAAEIDAYSRKFWSVPPSDMWEMVDEVKLKRTPYPTKAEIEEMVKEYKAVLSNRLVSVNTSALNYMKRKAVKAAINELEKAKKYFNQVITFNVSEKYEGGKSEYAGHTVGFSGLAEGVDKQNWRFTLDGKGAGKTAFTLIGFIDAGAPTEMALYKPGDNPDVDEPALTQTFKLNAPTTNVEFGGGYPTLDELVGYYADGTLTIKDVFISESFLAKMAEEGKNSDSDYSGMFGDLQRDIDEACDPAMLFAMLEEQKGVPQEQPFPIAKTDETTGTIILDEDSSSWAFSYESGVLRVKVSEEGVAVSGDLRARFSDDRSLILLQGELKFLLFGAPESDFCVLIALKGSKAV